MKDLAGITARYLGRPYSECGCIDFVYHFLADIGRPLPPAVDGWTVVNYSGLVKDNIKKAQRTMIDAFEKIGAPANTAHPSLGDLLVVRQEPDVFFPAVYVGNGQGMASFIRKGVIVFILDDSNRVYMARSTAPGTVA